MKVQFVSLSGQDFVFVPDLGGETGFENGEIRELSDDDAKLVLGNPNFVDAETGKNPNFSCATCGSFRSDSVITPTGLAPHVECAECRNAAPTIAPTTVSESPVPDSPSDVAIASWRDAEAVNAEPAALHDLYQ